jgi:hypothetical protein
MSNTIADFNADRPQGDQWLHYVIEHHLPKLRLNATPDNVKAVDTEIIETRKLMEVKSEKGYWLTCPFKNEKGVLIQEKIPSGLTLINTHNLFIERYSWEDIDGGPWQAKTKGATYFLDFFPYNKLCFTFYVDDIIRCVEWAKKKGLIHLVNIANTNHITRGYPVSLFLILSWFKQEGLQNRYRIFRLPDNSPVFF